MLGRWIHLLYFVAVIHANCKDSGKLKYGQWRTHGEGGSGVNPPPPLTIGKIKTALFEPISLFSYRDCVFLCCIKLPE